MSEIEVTIGFCPRERFSKAPEALASILEYTTVPFRLTVVDCATPEPVWSKLERQLKQHENVTVIHTDEYLLPSACKNLIIQNADTEYVCLLENDVLVEPGWVERFLSSAGEHSADVVVPLIYEIFEDRPERPPRPHFDDDLGSIQTLRTPLGEKYLIEPRQTSRFNDPGSTARPVEFMESHCLFFRREFLDRMQVLDGKCSASDEVDISMAVRAAGGRAIFDPACAVTFVQTPLPTPEIDRCYYLMRWDPEMAEKSHARLMQRWNLAESPQLLGFWHEKHARGGDTLHEWRDELAGLACNRKVIIVDGEQFRGSKFDQGLETIPFMENQGEYWGDPADDEAAICELEKDRKAGAGLIVFTWNTFWYFKFYSELTNHLEKHYRCVLKDERMVAFDLSSERS